MAERKLCIKHSYLLLRIVGTYRGTSKYYEDIMYIHMFVLMILITKDAKGRIKTGSSGTKQSEVLNLSQHEGVRRCYMTNIYDKNNIITNLLEIIKKI